MLLDNQKQKELLINIIKATNIGGNYQETKQTIQVLDELLEAVEKAEIKILPKERYTEPKIQELKNDKKTNC